MGKNFDQAQWIWKRETAEADDYGEFVGSFSAEETESIYLDISADSNCNVYLNGELVFFKLFADYPHHKLYDRVDISRFCRRENQLRIAVWYYGKDNFSYCRSNPGLLFRVWQGEEVLLASGEKIQSRTDCRYRIGYCKEITSQLGFSFFYDQTVKNTLPWQDSVVVEKTKQLHRNPLRPLALLEAVPIQILYQDVHRALVDLGREEVGFLALDLESRQEQTVTIAYGEHIADGCVRRKIDTRDFSVELRLKAGQNSYQNTFRRLAGRYIEIFYEEPVRIRYLGLRPVMYPVEELPFTAQNPLQQRIYNTAVRTLRLSMHEHYEDCPWREQAMYVLDSRNQMLCGYYCFDNAPYARENLILIAKGLKEDGLLELTYPARNTPAIPFFSLIYPQTVREYVEHTQDRSILPEVMPAVASILRTFRRLRTRTGLIENLPYPYWNFYEWSQGSDNESEITRSLDAPYHRQFDLILNCAYLLAEENYSCLTGESVDLNRLREQIHETFYDAQRGLYCASTAQKKLYTQLGNSFVILAGIAQGSIRDSLVRQLKEQNDMVRITLSMRGFLYDALLLADPTDRGFILEDIETIYGKMLQTGATSFWETEKGAEDFEGAGSLCHGWSAIPVYYFHRLKQ